MAQEKKFKVPWEEEWREHRCEYSTEDVMLDLGLKASTEIQRTDDRGKALGEGRGD